MVRVILDQRCDFVSDGAYRGIGTRGRKRRHQQTAARGPAAPARRSAARSGAGGCAFARPVEPLEGRTLLSLTPAGEPFRINAPEDVFDFFPTVAMDADGDSVVSWFHINQDFSDGWPVARMFDPQGNPKGPEFQVNTVPQAQFEPHVDMNDDGSFEVAFLNNSGALYVRSFDPAGNPHGPEFAVNDGLPGNSIGGGYPYADIASLQDGGFVIAFTQNLPGGTNAIFARRYDADDQPAAPAYRVDSAAGQAGGMDVEVAVNDKDEVMVAWRQRTNPFDTSGVSDLYARVFSDTDVPAGPQFLIDGGGDHSVPALSGTNRNFVVTWRDSGGVHGAPQSIRARRFNHRGNALGAPVLVQSNLAAPASIGPVGPWVEATPDGRFAVTWAVDGADFSHPGTAYLRQFDSAGAPVSGVTQLGTGPDTLGLGGFAADDNLAHGLLVWNKGSNSSIEGQFVADPAAAPAAPSSTFAGSSQDDDSTAATDLLYA